MVHRRQPVGTNAVPAADPENAADRPPQRAGCHGGASTNGNTTRQTRQPTRTPVVEDSDVGGYIDVEVPESSNEEDSEPTQGHSNLAPAPNAPVAAPVALPSNAADGSTEQGSQGSARTTHDINYFFWGGKKMWWEAIWSVQYAGESWFIIEPVPL
jgi:hypothetical protein